MPLTRDFKETIKARVESDPAFKKALFAEAMNAYLAGEIESGKSLLRDLVKATMGFEGLSQAVNKPAKSLSRMLSENGNPTCSNFFEVLKALQSNAGVKLEVRVE